MDGTSENESTGYSTRDELETQLHSLSAVRKRFLEHPGERFYSPDILYNAEALYDEVLSAAAGDTTTLEDLIVRLRALYGEARLRFMEKGILDHLDRDLADDAPQESSLHREIASHIGEARASIERARQGEESPEAARRATMRAVALMKPALDPSVGLADEDGLVAWPGDGWAPGTFGPPDAPLTIRVVNRQDDQLTVRWLGRAGIQDANYLLRQEHGGPWEVASVFEESISGWFEHTDVGLDPDTRYCYRVRTENTYGSNTTPLNNRACGHTQSTQGRGVWRLQVRLRVTDVDNAGSTDPLEVRLQSPLPTFNPNGNRTWLDYGPKMEAPLVWADEFDRGRDFTYDLTSDFVRDLSDITMLTLHKYGTNALGIAELELLVNRTVVFQRSFGESPSTCLWLDSGDGHSPIYTVDYPELRAHSSWISFVNAQQIPPTRITNAEMISRVESIIGDQLHGTPGYWRRSANGSVTASKLDETALRFKIRLGADDIVDPNIDINFDLRVNITCPNNLAVLNAWTENVDASADFDLLAEILTLGLINLAEDDIAHAIEDGFQPIAQRIQLDAGGLCPTVRVDDSGDIVFELG